MIGWLWRILVGSFKSPPVVEPCSHVWEFEEEMHRSDESGKLKSVCFVCRCVKCGEWKGFSVP